MTELRTIARHAGTVLAGQLAVMAFGVTDTIVAGRYAGEALAALSVGSAIFISVYVALMGVVQALLPVWAEMHGSGQQAALGRSVRQALYLCGALIALGCAALLHPGPLLRWSGVPAALQGDVARYLSILALAFAPALLFRLYATLNQALGKPQLVTWLQLGSVAVKVPLSIWFTFGGLGLAPQGVAGCAWATVADNLAVALVALWLLRRQPFYAPYRLWRRPERPSRAAMGQFLRLGVPGGLSVMVEVTAFTLMALFIARQGTMASAAHQIASNAAAVLYMVPLSIAIATSARASFWLGSGEPVRARHAVALGFRLSALMALAFAALLFIARRAIADVYTSQPAVAAAAAGLLSWVALYHLADAVQTLCVFVLRCWRVTALPLAVYCVLLWGIGLRGGFVLAYGGPAWQSPSAFWAAAAAALALTAMVFTAMVAHTVRR
ncbi:MATE family efflux transporter [Ramlibacter sp. H39-3-26]|uniref:MATE family efflux transporter n=1 Tax=Curvibacter soli TaxID=3031331 RepID=UPI0023DAA717|nr:MATE family efflux transporter [Ramlibacter sp. H39-3-26]MDF1483819.1 MATE family efflux transporter [Ramlibacter sp. H39-3-26]